MVLTWIKVAAMPPTRASTKPRISSLAIGHRTICAGFDEEDLVALPVRNLLLGAKCLFVAAIEFFWIIRKQVFGRK
jgi:hypothetical protein